MVIRAYRDHIPYMNSLPLHHSQRLLEDNGEYADFELFLAPTFDFIMRFDRSHFSGIFKKDIERMGIRYVQLV